MKAVCQTCDLEMTRVVIKREATQDTYVFRCENCPSQTKIIV